MSDPLATGSFESLLDPLGWMLFRLRQILDEGPPNRPPRWVRIAAARRLPADHPTHLTAKAGVSFWIELVSSLHELVMDLAELLDPITEDRQNLERTLRQIRAAIESPVLTASFGDLLPGLSLTLEGLKKPLDVLIRGVDLIPDREDALALGHQIYGLLVIKPAPMPERPFSTVVPESIDVSGTGRLRMLQWAFDLPWPLHGVGTAEKPEDRSVAIHRLGSRWLWAGPNEAQAPIAHAWYNDDGPGAKGVPVCELLYTVAEKNAAAQTWDITSLHRLLEALGYFAGEVREDLRYHFHGDLSTALEVFQACNGLSRTRLLDMDTLNRLMHLDVRAATTRRAVPLDPAVWDRIPLPPPLPPKTIVNVVKREYKVEMYEATPVSGGACGTIPLVNPDADTPHEEAICPDNSPVHPPGTSKSQLEARRTYMWYVAGAGPKDGVISYPPTVLRGWLRHDGEADPVDGAPIGPGFVAIQRRDARGEGYDGGVNVEAYKHDGDFFWAARHQAPSIAGRTASPAELLWKPAKLERGALVGMYQWYDLTSLWRLCQNDGSVTLRGRCVMRVGVPDRDEPAGARMVIALVDRTTWERRRYATIFDRSAVSRCEPTDWFPDRDAARLASWRKMKTRGPAGAAVLASRWVEQATPNLVARVEGPAPILYVGLHGRSAGNEDVAAYFDKVGVDWVRATAGAKP